MMNKKMNQTVNKEAFKMLAFEIGLNAACRKLGVPINTGKSWARRGFWRLPKRAGGRPQRSIVATGLHPVADALVASHKELEQRTKSGLAQATAKAAEAAAKAEKPLEVSSPSHLRDLAAAAARVFGWDSNKPQEVHNTLVISQEDLDRIFAEPVQSDVQAPPSSREAVPWPTSLSGPAPSEMRHYGDGTAIPQQGKQTPSPLAEGNTGRSITPKLNGFANV